MAMIMIMIYNYGHDSGEGKGKLHDDDGVVGDEFALRVRRVTHP